MNKKAQAAMEFLMTYGWAMLVVMVVISSLAYFGVLTPTALLPEKCLLPIGLECEQHIVQEGEASFLVRNSMGKTVTVSRAALVTPNGEEVCSSSDATAIENGRNAAIDLTCSPNADTGDKTKYILQLEYYQGDSPDFTHTAKGELITTIESGGAVAIPGAGDVIETFSFDGGESCSGCYEVPGIIGDAFYFDGVDDFMEVPDSIDLPTKTTISLWIRLKSLTGQSNPIGKAAFSHRIMIYSSSVTFLHGNCGVVEDCSVVYGESLQPGEWYHIVGTHDGINTMALYINGEEVGSRTDAVVSDPSGINFQIGRWLNSDNNNFNGIIDEVKIWDETLSASEVLELYNSYTIPEQTPIYSFESGEGIGSCTEPACPTSVGTGYSFDGVDDKSTLSNEGLFDFDLGNPFSVSFFIDWAGDYGENKNQGVITKIDNVGSGPGWEVWIWDNPESTDGQVTLQLAESPGNRKYLSTGQVIPEGIKTHYTFVYDGSEITIHTNGGTEAGGFTQGPGINSDGTVTSFLNNEPVTIGSTSQQEQILNGVLDKLKVWDKALSAEEVSEIYNSDQ